MSSKVELTITGAKTFRIPFREKYKKERWDQEMGVEGK